MINIHLNGDVIRCPDIAAMKKRLYEARDAHNICRYNIHEAICPAWRSLQQTALNEANFDDKRYIYGSRCHLSGCDLCPGHQKQTELGKQAKNFKIDNTIYRKLASTSHYLVKESISKTLFITLTFPKFKKKISYNETNKCFSTFVKILRKDKHCEGYIAVREFGKKTHRVHYHLLCSIPFIPFPVINDIWCDCIKNLSEYSRNAVQTDPKTLFIKNPARAMKYVCKYFAKCKNQNSKTRLYFISNNIYQKPKKMYSSSEYGFLDSFKFDYQKQTSDYTTCFRVTDETEFERFCKEFLYPFFELSTKKPQNLYAFPINSS